MSGTNDFTKSPDLAVKLVQSCLTGDRPSPETAYVSAAALRNASPIWRRMLDPENGFRQLPTEKFGNKELPILSLTDDDPGSVLILLKIMHYRSKTVPKTLTYEQLLDMAITCDKYDCVDVVCAWSDFWIESLLQGVEVAEVGNEGWLRIGYTFRDNEGMNRVLEEVSQQIAKDCCSWDSPTSNSFIRFKFNDTTVIPDSSVSISTGDTPEHILAHIWRQRVGAIGRITALLTTFYNDMQLSFDDEFFTPEHPLCDIPTCVSLATGSLVRSLRIAKLPLQPPFNPEIFSKVPVLTLIDRLLNIGCETIVPWSFYTHLPLQPTKNAPFQPPMFLPYANHYIRTDTGALVHVDSLPAITLPFTGNGPAYSVMSLHLPCPTSHVQSPPSTPSELAGNRNGATRCAIAERMLRFHQDVKALGETIMGFKIDT
ncbi:hypothetical protein ABW20_dc0107716 [Dactylellina cionopaga]|nr:hypothetical protein ABW20_dc0107716 [Dactylellina cionopaga]